MSVGSSSNIDSRLSGATLVRFDGREQASELPPLAVPPKLQAPRLPAEPPSPAEVASRPVRSPPEIPRLGKLPSNPKEAFENAERLGLPGDERRRAADTLAAAAAGELAPETVKIPAKVALPDSPEQGIEVKGAPETPAVPSLRSDLSPEQRVVQLRPLEKSDSESSKLPPQELVALQPLAPKEAEVVGAGLAPRDLAQESIQTSAASAVAGALVQSAQTPAADRPSIPPGVQQRAVEAYRSQALTERPVTEAKLVA